MSNIERRADQFTLWKVSVNTAQEVIEHLNSGIYPDIQPLDSQKAKKYKVPKNTHYFIFIPTSIPKTQDFIVVSKIIHGPDTDKYIIKCTPSLRPILDDFLEPSNMPPIKW